MDLLLPKLAALGYCQPDRTFLTSLDDLRQWLAEMAEVGEAVCVAGQLPRVRAHGVVGAWRRAGHHRWSHGLEDRGFPGAGQAPRALARAGRGPADQGPAHRSAAGVQPVAGRAAGPGRAGDRASGQRLGAAPLARAAVPGPRCLPGRWRARLPRPLAPAGSHMSRHHDILNWLAQACGARTSTARGAEAPGDCHHPIRPRTRRAADSHCASAVNVAVNEGPAKCAWTCLGRTPTGR
jgi:hypothetical protein